MQAWHLLPWLKETMLTPLFSHRFVALITSKLIWEGFMSWTFNSMAKFLVAVENHDCICNLFLLFMTYETLSPPPCSLHIFSIHLSSSPWVTGFPSTFWSMIKKLLEFLTGRQWTSNELEMIKNIGLLFDPFNCLLSQIPGSISTKLFATSSRQKPFQMLGHFWHQCQQIQLEWQHHQSLQLHQCSTLLDKFEKLWRHHFTFCWLLKYIK